MVSSVVHVIATLIHKTHSRVVVNADVGVVGVVIGQRAGRDHDEDRSWVRVPAEERPGNNAEVHDAGVRQTVGCKLNVVIIAFDLDVHRVQYDRTRNDSGRDRSRRAGGRRPGGLHGDDAQGTAKEKCGRDQFQVHSVHGDSSFVVRVRRRNRAARVWPSERRTTQETLRFPHRG